MNPDVSLSGGEGAWVTLAILWGLGVTILWLVIGWKAMRAHERIAEVLERSNILEERKTLMELAPPGKDDPQ